MDLLIADDDQDTAETLAELLGLLLPSVRVTLAFDGVEALAAATQAHPLPEAVITDIEMPRMDGVNAALKIRRALGHRAPVLIAVTGHVDICQRPAVRDVFDFILLKPIVIDALVDLLRTHVPQHARNVEAADH